jgi:hypothetical protein
MNKFFAGIVSFFVLFFGYRYLARANAVGDYEKFADAWMRANEKEALRFAEGDEARRALKRHPRYEFVPAAMVEAVHGVGYKIESFEKKENGEVAIEAVQTVMFDPPGITSGIGGAMAMIFHHSARVHETAEGWKVIAFEPKLLEMRQLRGR